VAAVEELREQLLVWEEALAAREGKLRISKKALTKVSVDLNTEQSCLRLLEMSTSTRWGLTLPVPNTHSALIRCQGEKKVELDGRERDISLCKAALAEAQSRGLNPSRKPRGADGVRRGREAPPGC
jgi:hypothetical protein